MQRHLSMGNQVDLVRLPGIYIFPTVLIKIIIIIHLFLLHHVFHNKNVELKLLFVYLF